MAVRLQNRNGTAAPSTSDLLDRELGVDTSAERVYIRIGSSIVEFEKAVKHNTTTSDPTSSNDSSEGYVFSSHWYNSSTQKVFMCVDNTASSAVWQQLN